MINVRMQPIENKKFSPKIAVAAVGGAGGNAVDNMIHAGMQGVEFVVCNTDAQALDASLADNKVQLGSEVTRGLGAGARPDVGRMAAEESLEEVLAYLENSNMVFVTAGMGGGTGTGAAPVIAKACRERDILTVGVVTKPFHFEGTMRMKMAEEGIKELQEYVDTLIVIPNQNLFRVANEKTTFAEAFKMADSVLQSGVRGVTDLIVNPGLINLDFADIRSVMLEMGKAVMGTGEAGGEKRAIEAAEKAISNPLLDDTSMKGARGVIINVTGGQDMTLFEADEACNRIRDEVDPDANIIFGTSFDENLEGTMRVSIVATGIDKETAKKALPGGGMSSAVRAKPRTSTPMTQQTQSYTTVTSAAASAPAAPAQSAQTNFVQNAESIKPAEETNVDLFEQRQTPTETVPETPAEESQEQTLRGTTYGEAFIPPAPATSQNYGEGQTSTTSYSQLSAQPAPAPVRTEPTTTAASLNLKPPVPGSNRPKKSPSLFERITGGAWKQEDEDFTRDSEDAGTAGDTMGNATPERASQGSLNIESPSKSPTVEDELDIPAFLRRQAN